MDGLFDHEIWWGGPLAHQYYLEIYSEQDVLIGLLAQFGLCLVPERGGEGSYV